MCLVTACWGSDISTTCKWGCGASATAQWVKLLACSTGILGGQWFISSCSTANPASCWSTWKNRRWPICLGPCHSHRRSSHMVSESDVENSLSHVCITQPFNQSIDLKKKWGCRQLGNRVHITRKSNRRERAAEAKDSKETNVLQE